jgi:hypothetical protein
MKRGYCFGTGRFSTLAALDQVLIGLDEAHRHCKEGAVVDVDTAEFDVLLAAANVSGDVVVITVLLLLRCCHRYHCHCSAAVPVPVPVVALLLVDE